MKVRVAIAALLALSAGVGPSTPAMAIGCLSGGVAGAVAGHMAHHGVLGAIGGCIAGHEYNQHQEREAAGRALRTVGVSTAAFLPLYQKDNLSSDAIRDDLVMFDDAFRLLDAE